MVLPDFSVNATTGADGRFAINTDPMSPFITSDARMYVVAYRRLTSVSLPWGPPFPLFAPCYRSATFEPRSLHDNEVRIYFFRRPTPDTAAIRQATVSAQVDAARASLPDVERLTATVQSAGIHVRAEGGGGTVDLDIRLKPATGPDLEDFLDHSVENIEIDLPGPDFLTTLCVDEDELRNQIRSGIADALDPFNAQIKDGVVSSVAAATGRSQEEVRSVLDNLATLTFEAIRFPVTDSVAVGPWRVDMRGIAPDPTFGFPRRLY